jgi:hypothetical protein
VTSFGVEFDRSIARARISGNERLACHLERIRPNLNLDNNDRGQVFSGAACQFADDLCDLGIELKADPFDMILIMGGVCAHVINRLQRDGLAFEMASYALVKQIERITALIVTALAEREASNGG